jgi:hypothetical protein
MKALWRATVATHKAYPHVEAPLDVFLNVLRCHIQTNYRGLLKKLTPFKNLDPVVTYTALIESI